MQFREWLQQQIDIQVLELHAADLALPKYRGIELVQGQRNFSLEFVRGANTAAPEVVRVIAPVPEGQLRQLSAHLQAIFPPQQGNQAAG